MQVLTLLTPISSRQNKTTTIPDIPTRTTVPYSSDNIPSDEIINVTTTYAWSATNLPKVSSLFSPNPNKIRTTLNQEVPKGLQIT